MRYLVCIVALLMGLSVSAQSVDRVKRELMRSTESGNSVVVVEGDGVHEAVKAVESQRRSKEVNGFRIVIFFDNGSSARANAEAAIMNFNALYPDVRSYMDYENPYFKVLVGGCVTSEEAIVLLGRITPNFPKAYITREDIKLSELAQPKPQPLPTEPAPTAETPSLPANTEN